MAENSKIEWTHHTFNPWIGCQKVGPGCDHCYAESWDARGLQQRETRWGPHAARTRTSAANWRKPLAWDRAAAAAGERRRVFCASLADVFDNHASIQPEWRDDLWALIAATPNLDWMLLTKRPGNIGNMLPVPFDFDRLYPNVWLGCTVVNQAEADRDIPKLLAVPAAVRFLSMEPLLGPVDLNRVGNLTTVRTAFPDVVETIERRMWPEPISGIQIDTLGYTHLATSFYQTPNHMGGFELRFPRPWPRLDLVIVGGESGPGARPMHPDWARALRDQCKADGVAFHFKQWGEWVSIYDRDRDDPDWRKAPKPGDWDRKRWLNLAGGQGFHGDKLNMMRRVGKKAAGRLLDGRTWDEMPGARHG